MNDLPRWYEANDRYLAASLAWLRLRLSRHTDHQNNEATQPPAASHEELGRAEAARDAAEAAEPPPALVLLGRRFDLSRFERQVLLLCVAMELDTRIPALCARVHDDPRRPYPTFALALAVLDEPVWDALLPERPLRYWRLIEIHQPGHEPLTVSPLRADERIVNFIKGISYLDDRLAHLLTPLEAYGPDELCLSQKATAQRIVRGVEQAPGVRVPHVAQLVGPDETGKQAVARHAASALGLRLFRLPAELLPAQAAELETLARLWQRECQLLPLALYLDAHEAPAGSAEGLSRLVTRFVGHITGLVFLATRDPWPDLVPGNGALDVHKPTPAEQQECWAAELGPTAGDCAALLASQFDLALQPIRRIARRVLAQGRNGERPLPEQFWDACLEATRPRLEALAHRLEIRANWDDLVLPNAELQQLRHVAIQVRQRSTVYDAWGFRQKMSRGLGVSVLFAGESGTGKTLAAEVLAADLRLHLYRIDLSAVVSKYIGETEKNLRRLFDAAEDGGAILFFDEADALFGKRSEVKDSHDRYANIETNYLLQRMEAYRGLAILATNMKSALDPAFLRRLRFLVTFPFPGPLERRAIWLRVFPSDVPRENLEWDRLARLNLTGGSIHNVALAAAFLAAQAGTSVTMPLVFEAARAEFRKLERPVNEADFRL